MISLAPKLLDTAPVDAMTGSSADTSTAATAMAPGGDSLPFENLMSGLLSEENGAYSQPGGPTAPAAQADGAVTESSDEAFAVPPVASLVNSTDQARMEGAQAVTGAQQPAQDLVARQATTSAAGGKSLPPAGNPLPPSPPSLEQIGQTVRTAAANSAASQHGALPLNARVETESERTQRLQQLDNTFDKSDEFRSTRELTSEKTDLSRLLGKPSIRDRAQLQSLLANALGFSGSQSNPIDVASNTALNAPNPGTQSSASQASHTVTVAPVLEANIELQGSESRTALLKAEPVVREQLATPYGNLRWHADFAGKLRVLSQANVSSVELNLNPAELGVIDIKIHALDDGTVINFFSANANTREVIDASLPRLRELLADSGIQLHHGDVSERSNHQDQAAADSHRSLAIELPEELGTLHPGTFRRRENVSMIDHYV